jgi:hypothetical protein
LTHSQAAKSGKWVRSAWLELEGGLTDILPASKRPIWMRATFERSDNLTYMCGNQAPKFLIIFSWPSDATVLAGLKSSWSVLNNISH